jgi:hypothetical protein
MGDRRMVDEVQASCIVLLVIGKMVDGKCSFGNG